MMHKATTTKPPYCSIDDLLEELPEPNRSGCRALHADLLASYRDAPGSSHNHQAWPGGYLDHIREVMNIAALLYPALAAARPLPFTLADAYLVLFLHDLEKPWKYAPVPVGAAAPALTTKADRAAFRTAKIVEHGMTLNADHLNAMAFVEGEGDAYSNRHRAMGELAAFCHLCDVWSARGWHDFPSPVDDPWIVG